MIIVMKMGASREEIENMVKAVESLGTHTCRGRKTTVSLCHRQQASVKNSLARTGCGRVVPICGLSSWQPGFTNGDTIFDLMDTASGTEDHCDGWPVRGRKP
jgi:hypothetical protein